MKVGPGKKWEKALISKRACKVVSTYITHLHLSIGWGLNRTPLTRGGGGLVRKLGAAARQARRRSKAFVETYLTHA